MEQNGGYATNTAGGIDTPGPTTPLDDTHTRPPSLPSPSPPQYSPQPSTLPKTKTILFWPSTEPLRALWDPAPSFGFGWVLPASSPSSLPDGSSGSSVSRAGASASGTQARSGEASETTSAEYPKDDEGRDAQDYTTNTNTTKPTTPPTQTRTATRAKIRTIVVAGVFPPYTSEAEARYVLRWRGVPHPEQGDATGSGDRSAVGGLEGARNASGLGERDGEREGAASTSESREGRRSRGGGDGARTGSTSLAGDLATDEFEARDGYGRAEPAEIFALNALGGRAEEGEGEGEIEVVLYERHEPGTLRYWEIEGPSPSPRPSTSSTPSVSSRPTSVPATPPTKPQNSTPSSPWRRPGAAQTIPISQLNASPRLAARVEGRKVRAYRPAAAVVLALFGAVLRPFLSFLSLVVSWVGLGLGSRGPGGPAATSMEKEKGGTEAGAGRRRMGKAIAKLGRKSALVKQVRERAGQVDALLRGVDALTRGEGRWEGETRVYVGWYNRFFNALWLILNDMTLGLAVGSFLTENAVYLAGHVDPLVLTMKDALPKALEWLDSWPAGLKLNSDLSAWYVRVLGVCVAEGGPGALLLKLLPQVSTPTLLKAAGYVSSTLGLSFLLALVVDMGVGLGCAGVTLGYAVARVGYVVAMEALGGLGALFRGKRYNALRGRMDTHDYDIDQLLFGTMLFTLVAFLSPTAVAFYFLFAGTRLLALLVQASLEIILAFINSFPLFLLVLKVKDGKRIPARIVLLPVSDAELVQMGIVDASIPSAGDKNELMQMHRAGVIGALRLESQPRAVGWVFGTYRRMWERLVGHYNPLRLGVGVVRGVWLGGLED